MSLIKDVTLNNTWGEGLEVSCTMKSCHEIAGDIVTVRKLNSTLGS